MRARVFPRAGMILGKPRRELPRPLNLPDTKSFLLLWFSNPYFLLSRRFAASISGWAAHSPSGLLGVKVFLSAAPVAITTSPRVRHIQRSESGVPCKNPANIE